jgi:pimeloyl-ACP methyl ester carboxylesterase
VVGMSLGGLTTIALAHAHPHLARKVVLVDVTPRVDGPGAAAIVAFVNGPESFADFDELLARTIEFNPTRSVSSLRRGILHNALQREDGSWVWRYRRFTDDTAHRSLPAGDLWDALEGITAPIMLVRGMRAGSVVDDEAEAELRRRQPTARVEHVTEAGHSVQGDDPLTLAELLADFFGVG